MTCMEIGLVYRKKLTSQHFLLTHKGMHRATNGVPETLTQYSAKDFTYDEENEPDSISLAKEWGVSMEYLDDLGTSIRSFNLQ